MQDLRQDLVGLEVSLAAGEVHIPAWRETRALEEDQPDAPAASLDGLAAAAALGVPARRALGAVDAREPPVRQAPARRELEGFPPGQVLERFAEHLEKRLRALEGRARWMKPQRHLPLPIGVGKPLAETQLSTGDRPRTAAAHRATARGGFEDMGHDRSIRQDLSRPGGWLFAGRIRA